MKAKPQILIVEDELIAAEDLQITLKNLGYAVSSMVSSGRTAIKEIEEKKPDLILMDIKLKGDIDGVEASEQIRSRFNIPIIYITGLSDNDALQRAKITEPFGYIHKPIDERELHTTIEMALYRHKMERKLKESEERYRTLFENSRDALYITTREGKIVDLNKSMLDLSGYTREEMLGMDIQKKYVNHADQIDFQKQIEKKGFVRDYEVKLLTKDGKEMDCLITAAVRRDQDGCILGYQGSIRDITERKKAEQDRERLHAQLIHSEKMAGIGTLAGGIAHEFNNLFQIIKGHMEFAQKTKRPEDIEEASNIVIHNTDRGAKIIKDLLSFAREEPPEKVLCDIVEPIESVLLLTEEHFKKRNINIVRKYRKTPTVEVNKAEMQQVFLNMVTNARDSMLPTGGKLEISVKQVGENVEVSFADTGKGIEKEDLGKLFEPFYTTKGATGDDGNLQGTGLGLSVSYGIVKRHGGTIEVISKAGKGSIFTIKLRAKVEKVEERIPKDEKRKEARESLPLSILAVDDEEEICKMFIKWLGLKGLRVKSASTGKKAIQLVKKKKFDFVFLDIIMPGILSIEVLEKIKKISPKTKVIMMSGKLIGKDILNELKQKGASGFLQKPFKIEDIMRAIRGI
jgi:two-component system cell cycle sensor histidine kinase/response regulator CckA